MKYKHSPLQPLFYTQRAGFYTHMLSGQRKCWMIISFLFKQEKKMNLQFCSRYLCKFCERVKQNEIYACLSKVTQPRPRRRFYGTSKHCPNRQKLKILIKNSPNLQKLKILTKKNSINRQTLTILTKKQPI